MCDGPRNRRMCQAAIELVLLMFLLAFAINPWGRRPNYSTLRFALG